MSSTTARRCCATSSISMQPMPAPMPRPHQCPRSARTAERSRTFRTVRLCRTTLHTSADPRRSNPARVADGIRLRRRQHISVGLSGNGRRRRHSSDPARQPRLPVSAHPRRCRGFMLSDMASMQLLDPESNRLRLLAWKGFHPQSAKILGMGYLDSASTCGLALSAGSRVVVPDIETCDFMAGTADLDEYRRSNIRVVQSTPLVSRSGELLGMISTHRHEPHQPTDRALRRLDVLARQAADLIERSRTEAALRNEAATVLANTPFLLIVAVLIFAISL
jgi:GAF domain-containing protein